MEAYQLELEPGWDRFMKKFDSTIQERIWKKVWKLALEGKSRHLKHGLDYFVSEVGGYRIVFDEIDDRKVKKIYFVGTHKQYENWIST